MKRNSNYVKILAVMLLMVSSACQPARMAVSPKITASSNHYIVQGHGGFALSESFNYGPYIIENVDRSWKKTTNWGVLAYDNYSAEQTLVFSFRAENLKMWQGQCALNAGSQTLNFIFPPDKGELEWELNSHENYVCTMTPMDSGITWRLVVGRNSYREVFRGMLTSKKQRYDIRSTNSLEGSNIPLSETVGYLFFTSQNEVGAVEVINKGAVWLHSEIPQSDQDALAAAMGALLLYQNLNTI